MKLLLAICTLILPMIAGTNTAQLLDGEQYVVFYEDENVTVKYRRGYEPEEILPRHRIEQIMK